MRRTARIFLILALLLAALCITALADGIYFPGENTAGLVPLKADDTPATSEKVTINEKQYDVFTDAVKLKLTRTGTTKNAFYLLLALDGAEATPVPTSESIRYIDQQTAGSTGEELVFNLYPDKLVNGQLYGVYISSNDGSGMKKIGEYMYYQSYMLGDVYEDGNILANDAQLILNAVVHNITLTERQKQAADVYKDNNILANDAQKILNFIVHNIDSLE